MSEKNMEVRKVLKGLGVMALLVSLSAMSTQASTGKTTGPKHEGPTKIKAIAMSDRDDTVYSKSEFNDLKKEMQSRSERKIANNPNLSDSLLSDKYKEFRTALLSVSEETKAKTHVDLPEQLDALL